MAWALGVAFITGLLGPDALSVVGAAFAAFVLACGFRRTPWHWASVSLMAWASGAMIGMLLDRLGGGHTFAPPSQAGAGVTVLAAYVSGFAGAWVRWLASRVVAHR